MRISDWSSDVCSSDLSASTSPRQGPAALRRCRKETFPISQPVAPRRRYPGRAPTSRRPPSPRRRPPPADRAEGRLLLPPTRSGGRSEEHTSELQSLMRISYAVFCLTKKIKKTDDHDI